MTWYDPLSPEPPPEDRPEHTGGGKLWMRRADGSLRHPTGRELAQHGHHGQAGVDVDAQEDDYARWVSKVQDEVDSQW